MTTLVDTGPVIAMLNRKDEHHQWVVNEAQAISEPLLTCEAVLAEVHFVMKGIPAGNRRVNALVEAGTIEAPFSYREHIKRVGDLMRKYENIPMSFADACLVRMAELYEGCKLFTLDSDFRIYRKHRKQRIELLIP